MFLGCTEADGDVYFLMNQWMPVCHATSSLKETLHWLLVGVNLWGGENDYLCDKLKAVITPCRFSANFQAV